jgi:ligand-binding sensor domain-containing protein
MAPLVVGITLAGLVAFTLWETVRAYRKASADVLSSSAFAFHVKSLDFHTVPGVNWVSATAGWQDAAGFQGHLYVATANSLTEFEGSGKALRHFRVGMELPPAPIVALATGVVGDSRELELVMATAGEGLVAFNGSSFRQIRTDDATARDVTAVLPLSTGRVLFGTSKRGVLVYDGRRITTFHEKLQGLQVTALAGSDGDVWVGTLDRGVLHWHAGEVESLAESQGLPDRQVLALSLAGTTAYIGTPAGVAEVSDGKVKRVLAQGVFARSLLARDGVLLVGTLEEGIVEVPLTPGRMGSPRPRGSPVPAQVEQLTEIEGKVYAVGPEGLFTGGTHGGWSPVIAREGAILSDRNVSALSIDPSGRLWVGYFDHGLDVLDLQRGSARHIEDQHLFCINRIVQAPDGKVTLVATANGLVVMDSATNEEQVLTKEDGLIADHVTDVALTKGDGKLERGGLPAMVIATPAGLTFMDASGMRSMYAFHGLVNNHAYAVASDGDKLMVGTLGGVSELESGVVRASFTTSNSGLKHNWVTSVVKVGDAWFVGTYGAGVMRYSNESGWESFADLQALGADAVINPNAMLVTPTKVYAGTLGRGLWIYDRGTERWSAWTAGLPSRNVTALASDGAHIYVGTDNGLVSIQQ